MNAKTKSIRVFDNVNGPSDHEQGGWSVSGKAAQSKEILKKGHQDANFQHQLSGITSLKNNLSAFAFVWGISNLN